MTLTIEGSYGGSAECVSCGRTIELSVGLELHCSETHAAVCRECGIELAPDLVLALLELRAEAAEQAREGEADGLEAGADDGDADGDDDAADPQASPIREGDRVRLTPDGYSILLPADDE